MTNATDKSPRQAADRQYLGVHHCKRDLEGAASTKVCIACGAPGCEWALRSNPWGRTHLSSRGEFSLDPADLRSLCPPCHHAHDAFIRAVRRSWEGTDDPEYGGGLLGWSEVDRLRNRLPDGVAALLEREGWL